MGCSASSTAAALSQADDTAKKDGMDKNSNKDKVAARKNRVSVYSKGKVSDGTTPTQAIRLSTKTPKEPVPPERTSDQVTSASLKKSPNAGTRSTLRNEGNNKVHNATLPDISNTRDPKRPPVTVKTIQTIDHSRKNCFLTKSGDIDHIIKEEPADKIQQVTPLPKRESIALNKVVPVNNSSPVKNSHSTRSPTKHFQAKLSPVKILPLGSSQVKTDLKEETPLAELIEDSNKTGSEIEVPPDLSLHNVTVIEVKAPVDKTTPNKEEKSVPLLPQCESPVRVCKENKNILNESLIDMKVDSPSNTINEEVISVEQSETIIEPTAEALREDGSEEKRKSSRAKPYSAHHPHHHHHHRHHSNNKPDPKTPASLLPSSANSVTDTDTSVKAASPEKTIRIKSQDEKTKFVFKTVKSRDEPDGGDGVTRDILIQTDVISTNENNEKTKKKLLIKMRKVGSKGSTTSIRVSRPKLNLDKKPKLEKIKSVDKEKEIPEGEEVTSSSPEKVANPPERSKDDCNVGTRNGQLSRTGSLTVLRRTNSRKTGSSSSRASSISMESIDSYASADLGVDKLPPVETSEALHACSLRLRNLVRRLEKEDLNKEDMKKNLEYAANVLETVYIDETRRLCEEDDELSEVEPDAVPTEVRDWLALTFTRSMSNMKRRGEDKPRFRSVAHAIRAGIMVDRIYRRMSSSVGLHVPPHVLMLLKNLDDWSFNVFAVNEAADGHSLKFVGYELLQKYDLITKFKINTQMLESFLFALENGYSKYKNPYHNLMHGADIAQTVHYVLSQSRLAQLLTDLEVFATLIAALIHDYEHTGTTNNFHINTCSDVALLYNDRAVLENHHISAAFRLVREEEHNILCNLSKEEYRDFRSLVIDMVLATDMSFHFQQIKNMKSLLGMPENIEKSKVLSLVLHCADISHPAKDWELHEKWTGFLLEEFFRQGDREQELGLPFSPLCDRKNTLVAESQIGFIDFIVDPSFQVMGDMLEKVMSPLHQQGSNPGLSIRNIDEAISEEVFENKEKRDKSTSTSSLCSRPGTPKSPASPYGRFELKRPWVECLTQNKSLWKLRAQKDAEEREKAKQCASRDENQNMGEDAGDQLGTNNSATAATVQSTSSIATSASSPSSSFSSTSSVTPKPKLSPKPVFPPLKAPSHSGTMGSYGHGGKHNISKDATIRNTSVESKVHVHVHRQTSTTGLLTPLRLGSVEERKKKPTSHADKSPDRTSETQDDEVFKPSRSPNTDSRKSTFDLSSESRFHGTRLENLPEAASFSISDEQENQNNDQTSTT
ncbi:dual specificity calcium/calmodulin-dependent 3',5'-cyclic nucleotide phosphodiesterase 1C-like isoform X4 [Biomphalaria glabrata]|uniref:Phosphodiesterase n=1 Tax=Biomphalaria glabrata TaxID=6526 RepID=A0A9W2Z3E3_BIOGL|nr:dual specificity calcium/calmodulin-dependent 3',5'-cyclic nucleotide phosphodiesterase 1C-like isoform X4 [Biomphalaria glabrata]